ncbi:MAG: hypothetical protein KDK66_00450 [Deltaproteobacteria bacterium]|nr:hypothetical protein [Deltaproteobacteria bacterium]
MNYLPYKYLPVGGTIAIGFTSDAQYLLVVSHDGRGLFDVNSGERAARDSNDENRNEWYRESEADGIGSVQGIPISIFGIDFPTSDEVLNRIAPFNVDDQVTEFKGACISNNKQFLAIGYSDGVQLYKNTQ